MAGLDMTQGSEARHTWANMAGTRIRKSEKKNKNVLEISIESERKSDDLSSEMIEEILGKLDIKMSDVETLQAVPSNKPRKLFDELRDGIDLGKYCRNECLV